MIATMVAAKSVMAYLAITFVILTDGSMHTFAGDTPFETKEACAAANKKAEEIAKSDERFMAIGQQCVQVEVKLIQRTNAKKTKPIDQNSPNYL